MLRFALFSGSGAQLTRGGMFNNDITIQIYLWVYGSKN